ncbi:MAG: hypothetical protein ACXVXT_05190 [Blastococcus sp.]
MVAVTIVSTVMAAGRVDWTKLPYDTAVAAIGFCFSLLLAILAFLGSRVFARRRDRRQEDARRLREFVIELRKLRNDHTTIGDPKATIEDRKLFMTMFWANVLDYESDLRDEYLVNWIRKVRQHMVGYLDWLDEHPHEDKLIDYAMVGAYYEAVIEFVAILNKYRPSGWTGPGTPLDVDFLPDWPKVEAEAREKAAIPAGSQGIKFRCLVLVARVWLFLREKQASLRARVW